MAQINAYLHFNGNCGEGMSFYKECFGGELTLQLVGETPMAEQIAPELHKSILHAQLLADGMVLMGSDMFGSEGYRQGNNISLSINCSSEEEARRLFANLSAGGVVGHDLTSQFWGALFGDVTDKFGVNWMCSFDKNQMA